MPRLSSFTLRVMLPLCAVACTITTSLPEKRRILGSVNGSSDVASPLQAALNRPCPSTLKVISSAAAGTSLPALSSRLTVTKARSSPSARIVLRSALSFIPAGAPAVRTVCSAALRPAAS